MCKKDFYIPGFDWLKLVGSTFIAFHHIYLQYKLSSKAELQGLLRFGYAYLSELVPIFFLIAGFLLYRSLEKAENPKRYLFKYIAKYGLVYFLLHFIPYLGHYISIYVNQGVFMYKDFALVMLTLPFGYHTFAGQLWFIPPLLLGAFMGGAFYIKKRNVPKILLVLLAVAMYFLSLDGVKSAVAASITENEAAATFLKHCVGRIYNFLQGLIYVELGMLFAKHSDKLQKVKPVCWVLAFLSVFAVELPLNALISGGEHLGGVASVCIGSLALFCAILKIKGSFLKKHHALITCYSGLTFLLHILEHYALSRLLCNNLLLFFIITAFNLALSLLITNYTRIKNALQLQRNNKKAG